MKCRQAEEWMDQALDETSAVGLSADRRARLEAHVGQCAECRQQWAILQAAEMALRSPKPVPVPLGMLPEFRERLAREEAARVLRPAPRGGWSWFWPAGTVAAGLAAASFVMFHTSVPTTGTAVPAVHESVRLQSTPPVLSRPGNHSASAPSQVAPPASGGMQAKSHAAAPGGSSLALTQDDSARSTLLPTVKELARAKPQPRGIPVAPSPHLEGAPGALRRLASNAADIKDTDPLKAAADRAPDMLHVAAAPPQAEAEAGGLTAAYRPTHPQVWSMQNGVANPDLAPTALPVEFDVSPAVLQALQRPVAVRMDSVTVQDAARLLTEEADVDVQVDPRVNTVMLSLHDTGVPFWKVLESLAKQSGLQIYPVDNQLVLGPGEEPALPAEGAPTREMRRAYNFRPEEKAAPNQQYGGAGNEKARGGTADARFGQTLMLRAAGAVPDRSVWPAAWGRLPERGFAAPTAQEFAEGQLETVLAPPAGPSPAPATEPGARPDSKKPMPGR